MKRLLKLAVLWFAIVTVAVQAQTTPNDRSRMQVAQASGYWRDSTTGLMWTSRDNGEDVSWKNAVKYCRDSRLAGYSDWKLATIDELKGIYEKSNGLPIQPGAAQSIRGNLLVTGDEWSRDRKLDDHGRPTGYVWYFDYYNGMAKNDPTGFPYPFKGRRALCVRHP